MQDGQPKPGDVIAEKYVVERVLGHGGMGTVYSVVHRHTDKRLALKCLLPVYVNTPSVVERFIREAKAVGRIQHRHVIDVFDQGRDGDVLYIVLPLLEGKTLAELLNDERVTLDETLLVLVRAMEGVAAAHALGVLHRDLKPSNIFVCVGVSGRLDDPRVLDFGISKLEDEVSAPLTRSGVAVGTPYYMPIEQLTGQRDLDARVDVYAMGVILYEAMAGVVPHVADNVAALAIRLLHTPPVHLAVRRPDLPFGLAAVVMKALARDRDERYPTVRALIDAITPFVPASAGLSAREPEGRPLRTPRDTSEPMLESEFADAAACTEPAGPLRRDRTLPSAPPAAAQSSLPPPTSPRRRVLRAAAVLGLVAGGAATVTLLGAPERSGNQAPDPRLGQRSTSADAAGPLHATLALSERSTSDGRALVDASSASFGSDADAGEPGLELAPPETTNDRQPAARSRSQSKPANKRAVARPVAKQSQPEVVEQPPPSADPEPAGEAETRAGSLAPGEF